MCFSDNFSLRYCNVEVAVRHEEDVVEGLLIVLREVPVAAGLGAALVLETKNALGDEQRFQLGHPTSFRKELLPLLPEFVL